MATHNDLGAKGEALAAHFLETNGYIVLHTNWRHKRLEIDLIATKNDFLILVEVKTRSSKLWELPELAVNDAKQEQMRKAAEVYLEQNDLDLEIRFDIVSIVLTPNNTEINLIEDAFR